MRGSSGEVGAGLSGEHAASRSVSAARMHVESVRRSARKKTPSAKALRHMAAGASPKGVEDGVFAEDEVQPALTPMRALAMDGKGAPLTGAPEDFQAQFLGSGHSGSTKPATPLKMPVVASGMSTSEGVSEEDLQAALATQARAFAASMQEAQRAERERSEAIAAQHDNKFARMSNSLDALSRLVRQQLVTANDPALPAEKTPTAGAAAAEHKTPVRVPKLESGVAPLPPPPRPVHPPSEDPGPLGDLLADDNALLGEEGVKT